ncbi:unnamed protein product [Notodromas monacha]|uniref:Uncharacterized protein n=1 Tax=Notodromas monacha TaxID=399045 RepID=A0A7R9BUZ3_9CRUS|nr:unnamed protein product [Notodromas monacha]CAG0922240.1 unnamed protein product [Notodromas monacha]
MQIQVHSTLSGPLSGWTCMNVDPGDKVEAVTDEFLRLKNVGKPGNLVLYGNNGLALDPDDTVAESGLTDGEDVFLGTADNYRSLFTFEKRWWLFLSVSAILVGIGGLVWAPFTFFQRVPIPFDDVDIPGKFPPKRKTYGAMDMGGASTQITFEVTEGTPIADPKDEANLRLFGHSYRIFSRSFTCFGINESHRRYLALLYAKSTPGVAISDPCGNAGRVSNVSVSWLFDSPCTQGLQSTTLAETSETVPIVGAWNETECSATIDELLSAEECNKYSNFCFNSSTVPPRIEGTSFIAFSIFYYAASELGLPSSVSEETFYEAALDETGEEFKLIEFRRKLPTPNGTDVGWALGFMINATNALPEDKPGPPMSSTLFSFLVFLFVGLSTCGSFMAYHSWILCRRRRVYAEYQRLNEPGVRNA